MNDTIYRQAAIDALDLPDYENGEACLQYDKDKRAIELLPSAQPERKVGEWEHKSKPLDLCTEWWYECSECGHLPPNDRYGHANFLSTFCPNCGAEMKGEEQ